MKKKYFHYLYLLLIGLLCLFIDNLSLANNFAGKWYQVELIIFSHLNSKAIDSEQWPMITPIHFEQRNTIQLLSANQNELIKNNFRLLPASEFQLNRIAQKITKLSGYQVLLHIAWQQSVPSPKEAKPIHIFGGNSYLDSGKRISSNTNQATPTSFTKVIRQVDGSITLSVKRYFDVNLNLYFAAPVTELLNFSKTNYFNNTPSKFVYFHLLQNRRMRSNELNYFDFPLYGTLIKITRIKHHQQT